MTSPTPEARHFFVDEAGDLQLFSRRKRVVLGRKGVSRFFMVGVAELPKPALAHDLLAELRSDLRNDPQFRDIPSMQPGARKTAVSFHANKDHSEVRRIVMARLPLLKAKVIVAVRDKARIADEMRERRRAGNPRLTPADVYNDLVKRLFRNLLHRADENRIVFARHHKWGRRAAMGAAIRRAKHNFRIAHGIEADRPTFIRSAFPREYAGLQVIDYYLWALQRLYTLGDSKCFDQLAPAYRLIMDLDDKTNKPYGEWYSDSNPLSWEKIKPSAG